MLDSLLSLVKCAGEEHALTPGANAPFWPRA